jgi:hypothetical protein
VRETSLGENLPNNLAARVAEDIAGDRLEKPTAGEHFIEKKKLVISYSYSEEHNHDQNIYLAESILRPILELLNFNVYTFYHDGSQRTPPLTWIKVTVKGSQILIGLITKDLQMQKNGDIEWHPKGNVPNEIGMANEGCLIIPFAEKGVTVCSNIYTNSPCHPFTREAMGI